MLISTLQRLTV